MTAATTQGTRTTVEVFWDAKYELAGDLTFLKQMPYQPW